MFGSKKWRLDTPIGADDETHHPDNINFSRPRTDKRITQSQPIPLPTIIEESSPSVQVAQMSLPAGLGFHRVTTIQETKVNIYFCLWHIARIPHNSGKSCWANHASTKNKSTTRIVTNNNIVPALTYTGMKHHYRLQSMKRMNFVFCLDDIERCIKGPRKKWIMPFSSGEKKPSIFPI